MQSHRDTASAALIDVFGYLVLLTGQKFYGQVTFKFRDGVVVGHLHEDRDCLVTQLPQATRTEIVEALKGLMSGA